MLCSDVSTDLTYAIAGCYILQCCSEVVEHLADINIVLRDELMYCLRAPEQGRHLLRSGICTHVENGTDNLKVFTIAIRSSLLSLSDGDEADV